MKPPDCVGSLSTRQSPWLCQRNVPSLTLWTTEYMTPVAHKKKQRKCKASRQCHLPATTVWLDKSFLLFLLQKYSFKIRNICYSTHALQSKHALMYFIFLIKSGRLISYLTYRYDSTEVNGIASLAVRMNLTQSSHFILTYQEKPSAKISLQWKSHGHMNKSLPASSVKMLLAVNHSHLWAIILSI